MEQLRLLVIRIITMLVGAQYRQIEELTHSIRLSAQEIQTAITEYGRTLTLPPDSAYELLDIIRVNNVELEQYSIRMPLWTQEEGRSDLTLELTVKIVGDNLEVALDDIHVL
jgi:hypothetical protein